MILKFLVSMRPFGLRCCAMVCRMVSMAMLVLPAPVGAQTSKFSFELKAESYSRLWITLRVVVYEVNAL